MINKEEIIAFYEMLRHEEETELRAIIPKVETFNHHFKTKEELLNLCERYNGKYNIYLGVNERRKDGTSAEDVIKVKVIPLDIDCVNKPANQEDLTIANSITTQIISDAENQGFKKPFVTFSGNGFQIFFSIPPIEINKENYKDIQNKIQEFEKRLILKYSNDKVKLDNVGDLPRIMRVAGTYNIKSKSYSKIILNNFQEDELLREHILNIKLPQLEIGDIPEELKNKIKSDEIISRLMKGELMGKPSRSEAELSLVCRLIQIGLDKNQVFKVMGTCKIGKWQEANIQYRELSYRKALEIITEEKIINKEDKGTEINSSVFSRMGQAEVYINQNPLFYDRNGLFWKWNFDENKYELSDETDILNSITKELSIDTVNSKVRVEIINALKQVGRLRIPEKIKETWLQFKDVIFDISTGERFKATPKYFVTNPISYKLHPLNYELTPTIDRIFEEWVGKDYVKTLYQIIAYCLLPAYPIHRLFCFVGGGMNGKSKFLELLRKFIGENNCCSTELDILMTSRFEITRLHKKLVCQLGETNFAEMTKTSILKKLTGGDLIGFEYKGKNPFEDKNYAKIIIATNNLPTTSDKTIGFYRRWFIIDFPNQFSEKKDILEDIPEEEYESLALKCANLLYDLLKIREFHNEGSIEERKEKFEAKSDFLQKFLEEYTLSDPNGEVSSADFTKKFNAWCKENRHRELAENTIGKKLKEKGYEKTRRYVNWLYDGKGGQIWIGGGLKWKDKTKLDRIGGLVSIFTLVPIYIFLYRNWLLIHLLHLFI